jgi:hypothetical protein
MPNLDSISFGAPKEIDLAKLRPPKIGFRMRPCYLVRNGARIGYIKAERVNGLVQSRPGRSLRRRGPSPFEPALTSRRDETISS